MSSTTTHTNNTQNINHLVDSDEEDFENGEIRHGNFYLTREAFECLCEVFTKSLHKSSNMMSGTIYELQLPLYKILVSELTLEVTCKENSFTIDAKEISKHINETLDSLTQSIQEEMEPAITASVLKNLESNSIPFEALMDAFEEAAKNGFLTIVERMLEDERIDPSANNNNSINLAAKHGHIKVVERLLQDGRVDPSRALRVAERRGQKAVIDRLKQDPRVLAAAVDL
jgi:hypothetical protein